MCNDIRIDYAEHKSCLVNSRETDEVCSHSGIITTGSSREKRNLVRKGTRHMNFKRNGKKQIAQDCIYELLVLRKAFY